jgi:hypothetical protein
MPLSRFRGGGGSHTTLAQMGAAPHPGHAPGEGSSHHHAGPSLHGDNAARRQAITELLFFSSVGDLGRCRKLCDTWKLDPMDPGCCDYDKRTPL